MSIELESYIKEARERGMSDDDIRAVLLSAGWTKENIEGALGAVQTRQTNPVATGSTAAQEISQKRVDFHEVSGNFNEVPGKDVVSGRAPVDEQTAGAVSLQNGGKPGISLAKFLPLVVIVGVLALGGGGAWAYFKYFKKPDPHKVIDAAWNNFSNVQTFSYDAKIEGRIRGGGNSMISMNDMPFSMAVSGDSDIRDLHAFKGSLSFDAVLGVAASPQAEVSMDMIIDSPDAFYIKANKVNLGLVNVPGIVGQWIKIDLSTSSAALGAQALGQRIDAEKTVLTSEDLKKIKESAVWSGTWQYTATLADENIDGTDTYHYALTFSHEGFMNFIKSAYSITHKGETPPQDQLDSIGKIANTLTSSSMELWIGKQDALPHKFSVSMTVATTTASSVGSSLVFTDSFKNFDVPVAIKPPADAKNIKDVLSAAFGARFSQGTSLGDQELIKQNHDSSRISDLSTLRSMVGLYLADVDKPNLNCSSKTLFASAEITPPAGWKAGANMGKTNVDGNGWAPIDLTKISSGVPIDKLLTDPVNDPKQNLAYVFVCDTNSLTFEFGALMESAKFGRGGINDVVSTDGGNDPDVYESGTNLHLLPKHVLFLLPSGNSPVAFESPAGNSGALNNTPILRLGRDARRISDLRQIQNMLELYFNRCGYYPGTANTKNPCGPFTRLKNWSELQKALLGSNLGITLFPDDPYHGVPTRHYEYGTDANGQGYVMGATLEDAKNVGLQVDVDGVVSGVNCDDPVYCVGL